MGGNLGGIQVSNSLEYLPKTFYQIYQIFTKFFMFIYKNHFILFPLHNKNPIS